MGKGDGTSFNVPGQNLEYPIAVHLDIANPLDGVDKEHCLLKDTKMGSILAQYAYNMSDE
jgi:hypothetical protein